MAITEISSYLVSSLSPARSIAIILLAPVVLAGLAIAYYGSVAIYNLWFHPLSKYPGPLLARASPLWMALSYFYGRTPTDLQKLHNQYGPVVRTGPNELSFIQPTSWKEIYGYKTQEFSKDAKYYNGLPGEPIILNADRTYHGYIRKLLAHGFSEKSLREQEPILKEYVDTLFRRLHEQGQNGERALDIVSWYNFLIFDFIGFLTFGESFNCLNTGSLHTWVGTFFGMARFMSYHQMSSRLPYFLRRLFEIQMIPRKVMKDVVTVKALNAEKTNHRLKNEPLVPDFMDNLVHSYNAGKMSQGQLEGNAQLLVIAGSETTATLLSGLTFMLLKNPRVMKKLTHEIRSRFTHTDEITLSAVNGCKYLLACIEEALRMYPPSPQPHHRIIPPGGASVNGEYLPAGTSVAVPIYAIANSELNFALPDQFIPERWTTASSDKDVDAGLFVNDRREASQPFSYGPRDCLGRNIAYAEMKLVMARMVWTFDVENATEGNWLDQRVYLVWEKAPLYVRLRPAVRGV
ncbi:averantin oxidoreductase [Nemania sp. FL0916]|nr:averantin oxidoreductase [Nemania sp. FL0916]